MNIQEMSISAKQAATLLSSLSSDIKNRAIGAIAEALLSHIPEIEQANRIDLESATGLATPLLKRLKYDERKINDSADGLHSLMKLDDPVGIIQKATELDSNLELYKISCPIGVLGVIFESRPDALVQISALALKSGNAVLMKGGSEALNTNRTLASIVHDAAVSAGVPAGWLQLLETRTDVNEMLRLDSYIDLIIPRGSNAFVKYIMSNTSIPVMGHADGICHVYVDEQASVSMAVSIAVDSKTQNVSVCNAAETLLVHAKIAEAFLPECGKAYTGKNVRMKCDSRSYEILSAAGIQVEKATDDDWDTEYLDSIISIKIVDSLDEAISHINQHGSGHTDAIVTDNASNAAKFQTLVDSADVFWNCSTRFADGFRFGLGAEVGISTGKIHARGPVGLEGLCTYKWLLKGTGQIVADYAEGRSVFTHKPISISK